MKLAAIEGGGFFCAHIRKASSLECAAETDKRLGVSAGDPYGPQVAEGLRRRRRIHRQRVGTAQKSKQKKVDKAPLLVRFVVMRFSNRFLHKVVYIHNLIWVQCKHRLSVTRTSCT